MELAESWNPFTKSKNKAIAMPAYTNSRIAVKYASHVNILGVYVCDYDLDCDILCGTMDLGISYNNIILV